MNAERLLDIFDRLGDEPEAVQRFRKLIVGLAMSGRLVAPDEAALMPAGLLKELEAIKRALIQQGTLRKQSPLSSVSFEDLPKGFTNPSNFIRLGEVARIEKGQTGIMKAEPGAYPLVVTAEGRSTCDHFDFDGAAAIVPLVSSAGHGKASLQRLHYQEGKFALGSILAAIFPYAPELISARFLFEYLTAFKDELLVSHMIGTANVSLSVGKVADVPVPLVPPLVQHKVDELMGLCDRLEAARTRREAVRDRLAAASLACLSAPDHETFQEDARFALDALPALTTRPDQIKRLRQTILNLAVRGKLVPQDANDEPASELLVRIAKEKASLVKDRQIRSRDIQPPLPSDERPFDLPDSWVWTRLGTLCFLITDGAHHTPKYQDEGVPFLSVKDVSGGIIDFANTRFISSEAHRELAKRCNPEFGDILLTKVGTTGIAVEVDTEQEFSIFVSLALLKFSRENIDRRFLCHLINSPFVKRQSAENTQGIGNKNLVLRLINQFAIPLPPLAEQQRIVAKVDALMALCDRLEASLTAAATTRRRLLDALLAEALAPVDAGELEAAD